MMDECGQSALQPIGFATGIVGGVVGYILARLLIERLGVPGVLLFTLPPFLIAGCTFVGFVLALFRLRGKPTPHDE